MADLVSESGEFSCNYCTGKLKLTILKSSSSGESKKLANKTNCFLPPPGGNCTFPGLPPGTPCVGCPPGMVMKTGQTTVKIDGPAALGDGAEFMCPLGQPVSLSKAGQTVSKHDEASSAADLISLIADFIPFVGSGKSILEVILGQDPITGEEVERLSAAAGILLGAIPGGKILTKGKKAAAIAKKVLKKTGRKTKPKPKPKQVTQQPKHQPAANDPVHGGTPPPKKSPSQPNQQPAANDPHYGYRGPKNAEGKHSELPRTKGGIPEPYPEGKGAAHTQLGAKQGRKGEYRQAREFDENGNAVKDIDFTDHGRPQNHTNPHVHKYQPNKTGGTPERVSEAEPLPEKLWNYGNQ